MRHGVEIQQTANRGRDSRLEDFVLERGIFNNIFEKDIRRVFIYKKAERLAKAAHLIAQGLTESASLRHRIDALSIGLIDAAILPVNTARLALSRELLALSSVLSIARTSGLLSAMNVELIAREAHILLQEVAAYEEPRVLLEDTPTLSEIAKKVPPREPSPKRPEKNPAVAGRPSQDGRDRIKDTKKEVSDIHIKDRREAVLSVIKNKGKASIKDISTVIRAVSEKTIQRELLALIAAGAILKHGERRWSTYSLR